MVKGFQENDPGNEDTIQQMKVAGDYEIFIGNSSDTNLKDNFKLTL